MSKSAFKSLPKGFKRVGVELPPSVIAIVRAADGEYNFPKAMAAILGAVPWIAVALYEADPEGYAHFVKALGPNWDSIRQICEAENPREAFDQEFARATEAVARQRKVN